MVSVTRMPHTGFTMPKFRSWRHWRIQNWHCQRFTKTWIMSFVMHRRLERDYSHYKYDSFVNRSRYYVFSFAAATAFDWWTSFIRLYMASMLPVGIRLKPRQAYYCQSLQQYETNEYQSIITIFWYRHILHLPQEHLRI
jgi:hypothetical protein